MEKDEFLHKFGSLLALYRKRNKMTQEDVSDKTEMTVKTISDLERGEQNSRIFTIYRLAKAANFSLAEVFSEFENMPLVKSKKLYEIVELLHNQDEQTLELIQKQIELLLPALKK